MRHLIISLICMAVVTVYTVFCMSYIGDFSKEMQSGILNMSRQNYNDISIDSLKNTFENKKNMLLLIANKEHIDDIEEELTALKYAAVYNNEQDIKTCEENIKDTVEDIKRSSHTIY